MNKQQQKQLDNVGLYLAMDMRDTASRALSAMIRSAMTQKSKAKLMDYAMHHNLTYNENFIV
jgi:hypothetical protein